MARSPERSLVGRGVKARTFPNSTRRPNHGQKKKAAEERNPSKRELIDTGTDKRDVRRDDEGKFKDVVDVGRSLAADRRKKAKTKANPAKATKATAKLKVTATKFDKAGQDG